MKFTLKDYQNDALGDILTNLRKAKKYWRLEGDRTAFSLTATTGAGKTVIAAAVFEAIFRGDETFDFESDPGAVVIWFSDDPSLNEQTRFRLLEAADRIDFSDLVVVQNTFNQEKFHPGTVYFLNTQKLSKSSRLVRGHDYAAEQQWFPESMIERRPDMRTFTIWDTIQNTIEDPSLTLYLVLDEAHRGMGSTNSQRDEKNTIVQRLINGHGSVPSIPVVWGISATVERFNEAMSSARGRTTLSNVEVDSAKVQESGLLKDTIVLDIPAEVGSFDAVLLRRATEKLKEATTAWSEYAKEQEEGEPVTPLMVLQVENMPKDDDLVRAIDTIYNTWPDLPAGSVAHVFGDHKNLPLGQWNVPYISPEKVQDATWVRILIAKDAISTGWDCPRAEVMVSFRPAKDKTHITQLLGRMVRTPLARRIPGNDKLNSVECLLPFFNAKNVTAVADDLMNGPGGSTDPLPGRRVLFSPIETTPNTSVTDEVWSKFLSLPSQSLPRKGAKPVKRLTALAHELAADGLLPNAGKKAHGELHKTLDAARARYSDDILAATNAVHTVEGRSLVADLAAKGKSFADFVEEADVAVIEEAYRRASRILSPDLSRTYAEYLAAADTEADSPEDALLEAHVVIAALGLVPDAKTYLEAEANTLASKWLDAHRANIRHLTDDRQEVYRQIKEMSADPQDIDLVKPDNRMENSRVREANGEEKDLPCFEHHLLADEHGTFPFDTDSGWEEDVLSREMARTGFRFWYRNPGRATQDSLAVAYEDGAIWRLVRPDFIFFSERPSGEISASIVDPHGYHYADALPKLRGLAAYAETYGDAYDRVDAVAKIDNILRVLDLKEPLVRIAVVNADNAKALYEGAHARDY